MIVLENLSVETIIVNSLVHSTMRRMIAVSNQTRFLQPPSIRDARVATSSRDLAVHPRTPALKEKEIAKLTMIVLGTWCVETIIVNSLAPSSTKKMIAVLNQIQFLQFKRIRDARVVTSSRDLAVHLRTPALKEKEIARLTMIVLENLSVETIIVNSLVHSTMRRMIAVSNQTRFLQPPSIRDARVATSSRDLAVHPRTPALKEKEIAKLTMIVLGTWCVETIIVNSLAPSSTKKMIAVLNQIQFLQFKRLRDARVVTSPRDVAVHPRTPALKEKEIARLTMTALENLSVEITTVNSLVHSIMRRMIAVSNQQPQ